MFFKVSRPNIQIARPNAQGLAVLVAPIHRSVPEQQEAGESQHLVAAGYAVWGTGSTGTRLMRENNIEIGTFGAFNFFSRCKMAVSVQAMRRRERVAPLSPY